MVWLVPWSRLFFNPKFKNLLTFPNPNLLSDCDSDTCLKVMPDQKPTGGGERSQIWLTFSLCHFVSEIPIERCGAAATKIMLFGWVFKTLKMVTKKVNQIPCDRGLRRICSGYWQSFQFRYLIYLSILNLLAGVKHIAPGGKSILSAAPFITLIWVCERKSYYRTTLDSIRTPQKIFNYGQPRT